MTKEELAEYKRTKRMEYYYRNKEKEKERREDWRKKNLVKFKDSQKESSKRYYEKNKDRLNKKHSEKRMNDPCLRMLNASYGNARSRKKEHNVKISYIRDIYPKDNSCPILGVEFDTSTFKGDYAPSLDRIDSSLGYVEGNLQIISWLANRMKTNSTKEQQLLFARGILKFYGEDS